MKEVNVRFIKRIYGTEDGDFSIFSAEPATGDDLRYVSINDYGNFTIAGNYSLEDSELGTPYKVSIEEDRSARYPNSYKLVKLHYSLPKDAAGQWEYVEGGDVFPLSVLLALRKKFGRTAKILDIIIDTPKLLAEVDGINLGEAMEYHDEIVDSKNKALLFDEYGDIDGVGPATIKSLQQFRPTAEETIAMIKENPFCVIKASGIGFITADKFRAYYGLPHDSPERILHGISYYLVEQFQSTGNTYDDVFSVGKLIASKLGVPYSTTIKLIASIQDDVKSSEEYQLKIFGKNITTKSLFDAELLVYRQLKKMKDDNQQIVSPEEWEKSKQEVLSELTQDLSERQEEFIDTINQDRVVALLGPGGSGKSWVTKIACDMLSKAGRTYGLYAPTARAAHVMSEYVGAQASTIHRGLMSFAEEELKAPVDVIIVDEASMVDSELAAVVIKTMGPTTRLIIIGDDFQLQSVGPGNILFDIVNYIEIRTVKLTSIFRQEEGSGVLGHADEMRKAKFSLPSGAPKVDSNDIVFINESDSDSQNKLALELYKKAMLVNDPEDIMLLSPVNNGMSGRQTLNKEIQNIVNPANGLSDIVFGAASKDKSKIKYFRKGDYITVKKNEYDMVDDFDEVTQLINGDLGYVESTTKTKLTFSVGKHRYTIDKSEINELLDHAWAITIHKSQGGQANIVIIVLPYNSYFMLSANMLYTAITRTQSKCYVIGDFRGINKAAKVQANFTRKTMIQFQSENRVVAK